MRIMTAVMDEAAMIGPGALFVPSSAQRKPSTTPTMGFKPYIVRHGSCKRLLGYAIGVANIQNCVMKGTIYFTSRNSTFSADNHSPTPREVINARSTNNGSHRT